MGDPNGISSLCRAVTRGGARLALTAAGLLALGAAAAPASAAPVPTQAVVYAATSISATKAEVVGSVFSSKPKCTTGRKVKLIFRNRGANETWDVGRTSREGAFGLVGSASKLAAGADRIQLVVVKKRIRKGTTCKAVRIDGETLSASRIAAGPVVPLAARGKVTQSHVRAVGVDGVGDDGAVFGFVRSPKPKCVGGRTVELFSVTVSGERLLLDRARASRGGGWAGHVTAAEDSETRRYVAVLKRKRYKQRGKRKVCAGDRDTHDRLIILRGQGSRGW